MFQPNLLCSSSTICQSTQYTRRRWRRGWDYDDKMRNVILQYCNIAKWGNTKDFACFNTILALSLSSPCRTQLLPSATGLILLKQIRYKWREEIWNALETNTIWEFDNTVPRNHGAIRLSVPGVLLGDSFSHSICCHMGDHRPLDLWHAPGPSSLLGIHWNLCLHLHRHSRCCLSLHLPPHLVLPVQVLQVLLKIQTKVFKTP